ncbi:MAG: cobyrinate a,c-diamide synthase [Lachnospiraceae bacterium]|nr:cobyrinate a,c-diamide synthase [Lachnospiraceae bacterium]
MKHPRIMLAAPKSGSGKTTITCALLRALVRRGKKTCAFKCGPDYIDPMFHQRVIGIPSRNLDLFFTGEEETRALFLAGNDSDISVIEGVMGLYDGLAGTCLEASSYHLACALKAPILLVINARGMGRSLLAEIAGFMSMDTEGLIRGVILNQVTASFYQSIAPLIREELKIEVLGYFPVKKELELQSRYLGLKLPQEVGELRDKVDAAADVLEQSADLERILEIANGADEKEILTAKRFPWLEEKGTNDGLPMERVRIGVAMDEAFCFYYEDNLRLLRNAGAELCHFSPLRDKCLPDGICGILLGGGYPELKAKELFENKQMRDALRDAIEKGMPSLAECGGFMYLHDAIEADGTRYPMAGVIHGTCRDAGKLVRFGYASFHVPGDPGNEEFTIQGHEFHYYDSDACGDDCLAVKPVTGKSWRFGYYGEDRLWGFGHMYYPSEPRLAEWFVMKCRNWRR